MSFSGEIKKELAGRIGESRHCRLAELSAIIVFAGKISALNGGISFRPESGNPMLKEKFARLVSLLFSIDREWETLQGDDVFKILEGVKLWDRQRGCFLNTETADGLLIQQSCCKRAYIRGAFLSSGSVSDPGKAYHFEIVCRTAAQSAQLQHAINSFDIDARIVPRKKNQVRSEERRVGKECG